ncbi:MAG TPA: hypothetical protein VIL49_14260 [Capillimicrobium sp.]
MSTPEAIVVGLAAAFFVACLLLGVLYPGDGASRLFKPAPRVEEPDEAAVLLEAANRKRAEKGKPPLTRQDLHL